MRKILSKVLLTLAIVGSSISVYSQNTIKGRLLDKETGEPLIGATVVVKGTSNGTVTDLDGAFSLSIESGAILVVSYIGYLSQEVTADGSDLGDISLESDVVGLGEILVVASVGIDRKTPVAMSNLKSLDIESKIGSQEFPEILKSTPGVFATRSGGGYGDGRINIRGFNDENVAVLINGIPVNDMENGNVYWSNWAGLTDATSTMQVQRGLGASKVAVPSVGGTINIISKASDREQGGYGYFATGNDAYNKVGFQVSTGLQDNGWALTLSGAKTQGDGYVDGTEFLGFSYFANISKQINDNHEVTFTLVGAKQRHGQRQNRKTLAEFEAAPSGIKYNGDWGMRNGNVVNVEDNFYNKPQTSLNHYWTISDRTELSTAVYASWGSGGGGGQGGEWGVGENGEIPRTGGTYGPMDIDALVEINENNASGEALAWQRASRNDHNWYGVLSTLNHEISSNLTLLAGVDVRSYVGKHFYEVTDLLGGDYIVDDSDVNNPNRVLTVGDKYNYNYDGQVGWQGVFGQVEYTKDKLAVFGTLSLSNTSYQKIERYNTVGDSNAESDKVTFFGYQIKGGANYNLSDNHNIYVNAGYFSKAPFFRSVFIDRGSNDVNPGAENEKIISAEIGYGYRSSNLFLNINLYRTEWRDRNLVRTFTSNDQLIFANILGVNAVHQGVEIDGIYTVNKDFKLKGMISIGDYQWANNVEGVTFQNEDGDIVGEPINVFSDGLKVGNSAQTTGALGFTYSLFAGLSVGADLTYFDNLFASFDPTNKSEPADNVDSWQVPSATTVDVNLTYNFDISDFESSLYANVYNIGNTQYVQDANDVGGTASSALVYYAAGTTWNIGLKVRF